MDLQTRVVNILTKPGDEWPVIAGETTDAATLIKGYVAILAAIPAVGSFIGSVVVGVSVPFLGSIRVGPVHGFATMIVQYVLSIVGVYVASMVIDKLAPSFESESNAVQALKLVVYASTPSWLAGVLNIVPALGVLGILAGLYGIYLFYLGVTPLMRTPQNKVIPYMLVSAVVVIVVMVIVGVCATALTAVF